ncbi:MAG: hypothetical protein AAF098_00635 [Pseudomonadota bacterium]
MQIERELRRVHYLQAMGITVLASRKPMPGAAPTSKIARRGGALETRAEAEGPQHSQRSDQAAATDKAQAPNFDRLRGALSIDREARTGLSEQRSLSVRTAGESSPARQTSERATNSFSIAAFLGAGRLWLELLPEQLIQQEQQALVCSMALALSHPAVDTVELKTQQFDWPMHRNQQLDSGEQEAAQALTGFIFRLHEESRCSALLCLGTATEQRLLPLDLPVPMRTLPSTRAILDNPHLKREAWAVLRA